MKFTSAILALALAFTAQAAPIPVPEPQVNVQTDPSNVGRLDWISTDDQDRTINCSCNKGVTTCPSGVALPAGQTVTMQLEENFIGNCHTVIDGQPDPGNTGMLAEIAFGAWEGMTYFDVSAIVVPDDTQNIYAMTPGDADTPISGCMDGKVGGTTSPLNCSDNIYVNPPDQQTKVTTSNYLKVYVGPPADGSAQAQISQRSDEKQQVQSVGREYIEGRA